MTVNVKREVPMEIDVGLLRVVDSLTASNISEAEMLLRARDCCQVLMNELFQLDRTADEDGVYAALPAVRTILPREKPLPKPRQLTVWEKFAKKKGIVKKKTNAVVLDVPTNEWKPRFGRKSKNNEKPWLIEGKMTDEIDANPYADQNKERKAKIDKNEKQKSRNLKKQAKKQELQKMIDHAENSRSVPKSKKRKSCLVLGDDEMNEKKKMQKLMKTVMTQKQ
eukprot:NODE_115_length_19014_cov_0.489664.p7 type:complete len:223 gc:universal NODE_115_length_19014_cov_0.489664:11429-10761(-)